MASESRRTPICSGCMCKKSHIRCFPKFAHRVIHRKLLSYGESDTYLIRSNALYEPFIIIIAGSAVFMRNITEIA